ncbi:c-type cytochrome [Neptuniibacter sp. QD37_6]|uniref:c-type cytochrome n=1 Tax=Neptuniibacter sp. QD37_6 TaxID=3398210 RepID=UPI0039F45635
MFKKSAKYLIALSLTVSSSVVMAHGGATGIVKERMDAMGDMKDSMKEVSDMFKGKTPYDADKVREAAEIIKGHSGNALTKLFPEGSMQHPTEAKPNIWDEWDRFTKLADHLGVLGEGLIKAAGNTEAPNEDKGMMGDSGMMGNGHMMGNDHMMGGSSMMGGHMVHTAEEYGKMPVEMVFNMVSDNCSSCHTRFRKEKE